MSELFTIQAISKKMEIPESTLRFWRDKYEDFIPSVGEGRKKRYEPEAIIVFQRIAELSAENLTSTDIAERLSLEFDREIAVCDNNSGNAATMLDLYAFQRILLNLAENQQKILDVIEENTSLKKEIQEIINRLDLQEELIKKKKWWKFWS